MAEFEADLDRLEAQFAGLEGTLAGLEGVTGAFQRELDGVGDSLKGTGREASTMSRSLSGSLRRAFEGMIFDGKRLTDTLTAVGRSVSGAALSQALAPVQSAITSAIGGGVQSLVGSLLPFAKGGALSSGRVAAFAQGGIVEESDTFFHA